MEQKFIVTIDSEKNITSREVADALNYGTGAFSLGFVADDIVLAKARKINKKNKKR